MEKKNNRRAFLKLSLGAGALVGLPAPLLGYTPSLADPKQQASNPIVEIPIYVYQPFLQSHFDNTMHISWFSILPAAAYVCYGDSADNLNLKAYPEYKFGLQAANTNFHQVILKNLEPGKKYYYQVVTKGIKEFKPYKLTYDNEWASAIFHFENINAKKDSFEFYMLNDIHDKPQSIIDLMKLRPQDNADFVFFNGDIFDYQTNEAQIGNNFLLPCMQTFSKNKPFLYVRGNHETRGTFARQFPNYFKEVGYQAFTLGNTRIIILDTGEDKKDDTPVYAGIVNFDAYREEQALKLSKEIKSKAYKKAKFKIVMMHIPPRYSGDWHGPMECTRLFEPLLNQGKVDLVLSGHTHEFKIHQPNEGPNKYALVIGGGPKIGERTLTKVNINANELKVEVFNDRGQEIGKYHSF